MDQKAEPPRIRPVPAVCPADGCGKSVGGPIREPDNAPFVDYAPFVNSTPGDRTRPPVAAPLSENLKVHEKLIGRDSSTPWGLHETGVFIPWNPSWFPRIRNFCRDRCCTHRFLQPLDGEILEGLGCETTKLWVSGPGGCKAKASSIRVGKQWFGMRGMRLIDLALRMGYLLAQEENAKVVALLRKSRGRNLILTPNLKMCTERLGDLLESLQARALEELLGKRGPMVSLPIFTEHDMGVKAHLRCLHPELSEEPGEFCECAPKGRLEPKRVVMSASRGETIEEYNNYGAVSYVWQECELEKVHQLLEDQGLKDFLFMAWTRNMCAKHTVRLQQKLDGVWIDQQCINQQDLTEKHEEIKNMRSYYANAVVVFVMLPNMVLPDLLIGLKNSCFLDLQSSELGMQKLSDQWDKQQWRTRVWTYQEGTANVNTVAVCSNGHIQLSKLEAMILAWRAGVRYFKASLWEPDCLSFLGNIASLLWAGEFERVSATRETLNIDGIGPGLYHRPLRDIIPVLSNRECSLVLDRVYGVLGLACDTEKVKVDYSMTEEELILHLAKEGLLSIDTLRATSVNNTPGYSWMPRSIKDLPRPQTRRGSTPMTLRIRENGKCGSIIGYEEIVPVHTYGEACVEGCIRHDKEAEHSQEHWGPCRVNGLHFLGVYQDGVINGGEAGRVLKVHGNFIVPGRKTACQTWQRTGPAFWLPGRMFEEEISKRLMQVPPEIWTIA